MVKSVIYKGLFIAFFAFYYTVYSAYSEVVEEVNKKAENYHKLLLKRPDNTIVFYRFVNAWLDNGDKQSLKSWLTKKAKSGEVADLRVLSAYYKYLGEDKLAGEVLTQAVEKAPANPNLRFARAKILAQSLAFENALKDLELVINDEKLGIEAAKLKGIYLARSGQIDEAVEAWKQVIIRFPKDVELREDLIELLVVEGLYEDAVKSSQELITMTKDPYMKVVRQMRLANIQTLSGKREEGVTTYKKVLDSTGEGTWIEREILARLESIYLREDNVKGLRELYQEIRETYPRRITIQKALAYQMAATGELNEAIALFKDVLKITPGNMKNRTDFMKFLEKNEKWDEVKIELTDLLKNKEKDVTLWQKLAIIEEKLRNDEGVKQALGRVWELNKSKPEGVIATANLYNQVELKQDAEERLRDGVKLFADSDEIKEALASFLIQNKKEDEAISIWREMAQNAPRDVLLRVARSLSGHDKTSEGYALLLKRIKEFENDVLVLSKLCELAQRMEEAETALPHAMRLIDFAQTPTDLEAAMRSTVRIIKTAEKGEEVRNRLTVKEDISVTECCLLAELFSEVGDTIGADKYLHRAEELDDGLLAKFYHVNYYEKRGQLDEAIKIIETILTTPKGKKTVYMRRLVDLLQRDGKLEVALERIEDWKRMAPGDKVAWQRRADILSLLGRTDESVVEIRRMIGKFGSEEGLRASLATKMLESADYQGAKKIYEQLYDESETLQGKLKWVGELAKLAVEEGSTEELLENFDKRSRSNPESIEPLLAKAEIYHILHQSQERIAVIFEATQKRPNDPQLLMRLAEVEQQSGQLDQAIETLRKAVSFDNGSESKERLAKLLMIHGNTEAGLAILAEISSQSSDPRKVEQTMMSLLMSDEPDVAINYWKKLPQHHHDWRLLYLKGICLQQMGKKQEAYELFVNMKNCGGEIEGVKPLIDDKLSNPAVHFAFNNHRYHYNNQNTNVKAWDELSLYFNYIRNEERMLSRAASYGRQYSYSKVSLPGTKREADVLSILKAAMLASQFSAENKKKAWGELTLEGTEELELFFVQNIQLGTNRDQTELKELVSHRLEKDPNNPILLKHWLNFITKETIPSKERANEMITVLKKHNVSSAMNAVSVMMRLEVFTKSEAVSKYFDIYHEAEKEEANNSIAFILTHTDSLEEFDEKQKNKILEFRKNLLQRIYDAEKEPTNIVWVYNVFSRSLQDGEVDDVIRIINKLNHWEAKRSVKSQQLFTSPWNSRYGSGYPVIYPNSRWSRSGSQRGYLIAPTKHPTQIKGIHQIVRNLVANSIPRRQQTQEAPVLDAEQKRLWKLLGKKPDNRIKDKNIELSQSEGFVKQFESFRGKTDQIEHAILRALILLIIKDEDAFKAMIQGFEKSNNFDELQLAAGYSFEEGNNQKAYHLLQRVAGFSGLSATERKIIDGQLIVVGAKCAEEKDNHIDLNDAKRAALRMRKILPINQQQQLFRMMNTLGLSNEVVRLTKLKKLKNSRRTRINRPSIRLRQGLKHSLVLMQEEKKDAALYEAIKGIRRILRTSRRPSSELEKYISFLKQHDVVDDAIAKMKPADSASFNQRLQYASFIKLLGRDKEAKLEYGKLIEERPDSKEAYSSWISVSDKDQVVKRILSDKKSIPSNLEEMGTVFYSLGQAAENDINVSLHMMSVTAELLNQLDSSMNEDINLSWVNYTAMKRVEDIYFKNYQLLPLIDITREGKVDAKSSEKSNERDRVAKELFISMLKHPQTAKQGFILLRAARARLNLKEDQLLKFAKKAAIEMVRKPQELSSYHVGDYTWVNLGIRNWSQSANDPKDSVDPFEYLASQAIKTDEELLSEELLATIKKNQPQQYQRIELVWAMQKANNKDMGAIFTEWKDNLPENISERDIQVRQLIDILLLIKPSVETWGHQIEDLILKGEEHRGREWYEAISKWAQWKMASEGRVACEQFLEKLVITQLATKDKWPILAQLGRNRLPNDFQQNAYNLDAGFSVIMQNPQLGGIVGVFVIKNNFSKVFQNSFYQVQTMWRVTHYSPEDFIKWLKKCQFIEKTAKDDPFEPGRVFFVSDGMTEVRLNDSKMRAEAAQLLLAEKSFEPILAQILAANFMEKDKGCEIFIQTIANNPKDFAVLKAHSKSKTEKLIKYWLPNLKSDNSNQSVVNYLKAFRDDLSREAKEKALTWMDKEIKAQENRSDQKEKYIPYVIQLVEHDPYLAAKVWNKILGDVKKQHDIYVTTTPYSSGSDSWDYSWHEFLIHKIFTSSGSPVSPVNQIKFVHSFYQGEASNYLPELSGSYSSYSRYAWQNFEKTLKKQKVPKGKSYQAPGLALENLAKNLTQDEQATMMVLFLQGMVDMRVIASNSRDDYTKWVRSRYAEKSDPVALGMKSLSLIRMLSYTKRSDEQKELDMKQMREDFNKLLAHQGLSIPQRTDLVRGVNYNSSSRPLIEHPDAWREITKLMIDYSKGNWMSPRTVWTNLVLILASMKFEGRNEVSRDLAKAADMLLLKQQKTNLNISYSNVRGIIMLEIDGGGSDIIKYHIKTYLKELRGDLNLMLELTKQGQFDVAKQLVVPDRFFYNINRLDQYTLEFHELSQKLISHLPENSRYRVEVLLAAREDPSKSKHNVVRKDRLIALAERYNEEKPSLRAARVELLALFAQYPDAAKIVDEALHEEAEKTSHGKVVIGFQSSDTLSMAAAQLEILLAQNLSEIQNRKYDTITNDIKSLRLMKGSDGSYYAASNAGKILRKIGPNIVSILTDDPEQGKQMLPLAEEVMKCSIALGRQNNDIVRSSMLLSMMIYAVADRPDQYDAVVNSIKSKDKEAYESLWTGYHLRYGFRYVVDDVWLAKDNEVRRRKIAATLFNNDWFCSQLIKHCYDYRRFEYVIQYKFLTYDELYDTIAALPEKLRSKPELLCEVAYLKSRKSVEDADKDFAKAYDLAKTREDKSLESKVLFHRSQMWANKRKYEKARKWAKEINVDLLGEKDRETFKQTRERLKKVKPVK